MRIWRGFNASSQNFHGSAITIGNFDGLHLGHQQLLKAVQKGVGPKVVITFDPHPVQILQPERRLSRLFPTADLEEQLPKYGMDLLVIVPFTGEFSRQPAAEFARDLQSRFQPSKLVVGYDFAFGRNREGTLDWLSQWAQAEKIDLTKVPALQLGGQTVSSRRLRELIVSGQVSDAEALLGRPFYLRGIVQKGAGRGKGLGFPTLNQAVVNETLPASGVYVTCTRFKGTEYPSVTNVGVVPTFTESATIQVETHLLHADVNAYGENVDVEFIRRIRPEMKFASVEDLRKQITQDILEADKELQVSESKKWTVISPTEEDWRWQHLSRQLSNAGVVNEYVPWTGPVDSFEEISVLDPYHHVRVSTSVAPQIFKKLKVQSSWTTLLGVVDGMVRTEHGWWPLCALYEAFGQILIGIGQGLDMRGSVMVAGAGGIARTAIAAFFKAGFKDFLLTNFDVTEAEKLISEIRGKMFGMNLNWVPMEKIVLLPGDSSALVNCTPSIEENALLIELSYLNFLKRPGFLFDSNRMPKPSILVQEAKDSDVSVIDGFEIASRADVLWAKWAFGAQLDLVEYKRNFHQTEKTEPAPK